MECFDHKIRSQALGIIFGNYEDDMDYLNNIEKTTCASIINGMFSIRRVHEEHLSKCKSPIEKILCAELLNYIYNNRLPNYTISPQHVIHASQRYKIDLMVHKKTPQRIIHLAVECDGAPNHSSPEQKERDKERDDNIRRELGIPTLRFSGSNIVCAARKCAEEIINTIEAISNKNTFYHIDGGD